MTDQHLDRRRLLQLAAALPLSGCGRGGEGRGKTTLRFWAMGREGEVAKA